MANLAPLHLLKMLRGEGNLNQVYIWKERISPGAFDYAQDDGLREDMNTMSGAK